MSPILKVFDKKKIMIDVLTAILWTLAAIT